MWIGFALVAIGMPFFLGGTLGLLRFPDVYTRLHALTKADNLGLGLVTAGLVVQASSWAMAAKLVIIWLLVLIASATACHLVARSAFQRGVKPWQAP
jgi:multicomponent Na+:H+ antiporter subunit G